MRLLMIVRLSLTGLLAASPVSAQLLIQEAEFPRLARSLDYEWYETQDVWWALRAEANFSGSASMLVAKATDETTSTVLASGSLTLPFSRNGAILPIDIQSPKKMFLVCGGGAGATGQDSVVALISVQNVTGSLNISVEASSSIVGCDAVGMCSDRLHALHHGPIYVLDWAGERVLAGNVVPDALGEVALPSTWTTIVDASSSPLMSYPLELQMRPHSFELGDEAKLVFGTPGRGWSEHAAATIADIRHSTPWSVSSVSGVGTSSQFTLEDPNTASFYSGMSFRLPQGASGAYEIWDATAGTHLATHQAAAGVNALPTVGEAFMLPGHRYELRHTATAARRRIWLPVRYGQPWSQMPGFEFGRVICEQQEAIVGSQLFGFAVETKPNASLAGNVNIQAWINIRVVVNGVVNDHIQIWNGTDLLSPSMIASYQLTSGTLPSYVGVGAPLPNIPELDGLVVLCQFVAEQGGLYALSDVIGVGVSQGASSPSAAAMSGPSTRGSSSAGAPLVGGAASWEAKLANTRQQLLQVWAPQGAAQAQLSFSTLVGEH